MFRRSFCPLPSIKEILYRQDVLRDALHNPEADSAMKSGKLDEELGRMDALADRLQSGERAFKIEPGKPLQTVFGEDLYRRSFF